MRSGRILPLANLPIAAIAFLLAFATLGGSRQAEAAPAAPATVTLRIGGTGSALGGMHLLARAFMEERPDIHVVVLPSLGSGGGLKALAAGKIDLSLSARPLKEAERKQNLQEREYARTPIVFATEYDNPVENVTLDEVTAIYAGRTTRWENGARMRLVLRPASETDTRLLRDLSPAMDKAVQAALDRTELHMAINDQDNATALENIPGAFGVTTLAQIITEQREIKPLALNGIAGTGETLQSGKYPHAKRFFLVTSSDAAPAADAFVRFVFSPDAQAILTSTGHVVVGESSKSDM